MYTIYSVLFNIFKYAVLAIVAGVAGMFVMAQTTISALLSPFAVVSNLTSLVKADPNLVDQATSDHRDSSTLIALLATWVPALAASFVTNPHVAMLLVLPSLIGLGLVGIRQLEFSGSGSNQYSPEQKVIGNVSAATVAAVAVSIMAPVLSPNIFCTAVLTGVLITVVSRLRNAPKSVSLPIALTLGVASGYVTGGLLGAAVVLAAAAIQINAIGSAVTDLANAGDSENKQIRAKGDYAVSFTLLKTTIVAAAFVLISLIH